MQESIERYGIHITIKVQPTRGQHVRTQGSDLQAGSMTLRSGQRLDPRLLGLAAASGAARVCVCRPIRVALIAFGAEIIPSGEPLSEGQIWDVNSPMLRASLARPDIDMRFTLRAKDDPVAAASVLRDVAPQVDLIITSGGASVGDFDPLHEALDKCGARLLVDGIAIKPGKPVICAMLENTAVLGLPGNPVAAFVGFFTLGNAIIDLLNGATALSRKKRVRLAKAITRKPGREEYLPSFIEDRGQSGSVWVTPGPQDFSAMTGNLAVADGLLVLPRNTARLEIGDSADFVYF